MRVKSANSLVKLMMGYSADRLVSSAHVVHLHARMFGSSRQKATAIVSNCHGSDVQE